MHVRLVAVLAAVSLAAVLSTGPTHADPPPHIEPIVWQLNRDYPEGTQPDSSLSINTVYIKTHDATDWMSTYDAHPLAVSGPEAIQNLIQIYNSQGINVAAWFVPKGHDYDTQVAMAIQVIDSGVTALYADLEPFSGFCNQDCASLASNFWARVRQARPNARLGVIYDPRPWWWNQSATSSWFANADVAMPMCYWETYSGQGVFGDPAGCVTQAKADLSVLSPNRTLEYLPILQGDSSAASVKLAMDAAIRSSASRISLWRRGVVSNEVWQMIDNYEAPSGPHCAENLVDGCVIRDASSSTVYLVRGGAKFAFPSWDDFVAMGYGERDIQVMPDGAVDAVRSVPPDGTLVQEFGSDTVYVIVAGARFIVSPEAAPAGDIPKIIPRGASAQIPAVPANYTRLRETTLENRYVVLNGSRIELDELGDKALADLGYPTADAFMVPDGGLTQIPVLNVRRGDVNCDGNVNGFDVLGLMRRTIDIANPSACIGVTGDVNCDGQTLTNDALLVLLYYAEAPAPAPAQGCPAIGEAHPGLLPGSQTLSVEPSE